MLLIVVHVKHPHARMVESNFQIRGHREAAAQHDHVKEVGAWVDNTGSVRVLVVELAQVVFGMVSVGRGLWLQEG